VAWIRVNFRSLRLWSWLILVPSVLGASIALLTYAGWSAVYSAYYGLPSEAWRLKEAGSAAELYGWVFVVLSVVATIAATILTPPVKLEVIPPAVSRFLLAMFFVACSVFTVAYGLSVSR
jgi:hypothetical protein